MTSQNEPFLAIDFGTTNSSAAVAGGEVLLNAEGELKTPSLVYYGEEEVLVGRAALNEIENLSAIEDSVERRDAEVRAIHSVKRCLSDRRVFALPDGRTLRPQHVVADILGKIKRDAEVRRFHRSVSRVVLTHPAVFDGVQKQLLREAAELAGFETVELLEEPAAAAIAYAAKGPTVGDSVLVYDLGGGTFDLAVLVREPDGSFHSARALDGDPRCGGDDFDQMLYDHWDAEVRRATGAPVSENGLDTAFFLDCRRRKEHLTNASRARFSSMLSGARIVPLSIDRPTFENLIRDRVDHTARKTKAMLERAEKNGRAVDTVVMIGGAARTPLVRELLAEAISPLVPLEWADQDLAVAKGAAIHGEKLWGGADQQPTGAQTEMSEARGNVVRLKARAGTDSRQSARTEAGTHKSSARQLPSKPSATRPRGSTPARIFATVAGLGLLGMLAIGGVVLSGAMGSSSTVSNSVSRSSEAPGRRPVRKTEDPPSRGFKPPLTVPQLRYCEAETIRIDAARAVFDITDFRQAGLLNGWQTDFNLRCANASADPDDVDRARADVAPFRSAIEEEGRRVLRGR